MILPVIAFVISLVFILRNKFSPKFDQCNALWKHVLHMKAHLKCVKILQQITVSICFCSAKAPRSPFELCKVFFCLVVIP